MRASTAAAGPTPARASGGTRLQATRWGETSGLARALAGICQGNARLASPRTPLQLSLEADRLGKDSDSVVQIGQAGGKGGDC